MLCIYTGKAPDYPDWPTEATDAQRPGAGEHGCVSISRAPCSLVLSEDTWEMRLLLSHPSEPNGLHPKIS